MVVSEEEEFALFLFSFLTKKKSLKNLILLVEEINECEEHGVKTFFFSVSFFLKCTFLSTFNKRFY